MKVITNGTAILIEPENKLEEDLLRIIAEKPSVRFSKPPYFLEGELGALVISEDKTHEDKASPPISTLIRNEVYKVAKEALSPQTVTRHEVYEIAKEVAKQEIQNYMKRCLYGDGIHFVNGGR